MKPELPNTRNIVVWPKGSVADEKKPKREKVASTVDPESSFSFESLRLSSWWTEKHEFTLFFCVGSVIWIWLVKAALRWLKFPVHRHSREVYLFYCLPLIVLFLVLYVFDFIFNVTSKKLPPINTTSADTKKRRSGSMTSDAADSAGEEDM